MSATNAANAIEAHGEALFALSAIMLKKKLFPEKGNELTDAYERVVQSWAALTETIEDPPAAYTCKHGCERDALMNRITAAAKEMREACARVAESHADQCEDTWMGRRTNQTARNVAEAIRALNQEETPV